MIRYFSNILKSIIGSGRLYMAIHNAKYLFRSRFIVRPRLVKSMKPNILTKSVDETRPLVVVPILETNHYSHLHILGMAKAFSVRGFDILVVICDEYLPACEIMNCRSPVNVNPCFKCNTNRKHLLNSFGLNTLTLSSALARLENPVEYGRRTVKDFGLDQTVLDTHIADSVTRHFYGGNSSFPEKDVLMQELKHTDAAYISLALGRVLLEEYSPSICFNQMRNYSAWGPIFYFLESVGVAPITMTSTAFDFNSVRFNDSDLFRHKRTYERFLSQRENNMLSPIERISLTRFLGIRKSGDDTLMKKWGYFDDSANTDLGINKSKKNVFLFTNVPWDVGLNEFAGPFNDVLDWVSKTIEHFKLNEEIDIWIKPHPAEVRSTAKSSRSVADFIRHSYPELPPNIHVIDPALGLNTYALFQYIDVGVILTGTLGLEMALDGIPVVSAGINPCYGLGLLSEPKDLVEYFEAIMSGDNGSYEKTQLELFCYFYFIHQSFQWPLSERAFGNDDFSGFSFNQESELERGNIVELDIMFDEINLLIDDYKARAIRDSK